MVMKFQIKSSNEPYFFETLNNICFENEIAGPGQTTINRDGSSYVTIDLSDQFIYRLWQLDISLVQRLKNIT